MKKTTLFSLLAMMLLFVGGKAWADTYSHTFVTTDIPEGTTETSFTLSDVDWTLTLDGGKVSVFSNDLGTHFGTNNATCNSVKLSTDGIPGTIANVTVEASRGKNLVGTLAVTVGGTDYFLSDGSTTTALTTENAAYDYSGEASGEIAIVWTKDASSSASKGAFYIKKITIEYSDGGVIVAKPVITPNGGTFTEPQTVTITAGEDCTIYYTTDGTDPGFSPIATEPIGTEYTQPFTVSEDCTVKAVALDVTGASSSIAEAVFKFPTAYTSIAALCADATSTETSVLVEFNNWICTGVKSSNAYFTDGRNGIQLYQSGHGFKVGDELTGTATVRMKLYNECAEIMGLTANTEGVTVTQGEGATPMTLTIADLQKDMQGCLIHLEGLTYSNGVFVDADDNTITPYDSFGAAYTLEDGATYDATGVAIWFVKSGNGYWEIAPRTADEFQLAGAVVAKPVISPNGGTFAEPQEVTITAGEDCTIYYTTDGTDPGVSPVAEGFIGTQYTEPFTISQDCTVKAIALDVTGAPSAIASAEFKFLSLTAITRIAELCAAVPEEGETDVLVEFNDWIVTGVKGKNVYFTDGKNGVQLFQDKHNFELGDKITGSAVVKLTSYNECAELIGLTSETEGITVEKGATVEPMAVAIADLENNMQGCLISLEGVTYSEGVFVDDDDNTIKPYGTFITLPALMEGKTYNATGVAIWYAKDAVWEIAPRTADEFVLVTSQIAPTSAWSVESEVVDVTETPTAKFTTDSDGEVTYQSSDESVATIDEEGNITPMGRGITIITAFVAETETYLPDEKSFTLTVTKDGYADATFAYKDPDIEGQGAPNVGAELTATRDDIVTLYANRAYAKTGDTHIKVYGTNATNGPSYLQLSAVEGYAITQIVLTVTGKTNLGIWRDQFDREVEVEKPDSVKATWTGFENKVVLTNWASKQAQVKYIDVTFVKLEDTGKTVTIGESGFATFCSDTKVVLSQEGEWAVAGTVAGTVGRDGTVINIDTLGTAIPSNTGVILMGYRGEYKVYTHKDIEENYPTVNFLTGVLEDTEAPVGSYVMDEVDVIPTFNVVAAGDAVTVNAGHAYLEVPSVAGIPTFFFTEEDYETGVKAIAGTQQTISNAIYNLAGQRLSKMQKGINIVDGKKIAIK